MRRNHEALLTKPERAIRKALRLIEEGAADERLTNASIKLQEALNLVSDYVDDYLYQVFLV